MKALQTIGINADNAILVVVDMQNEFCQPGGTLYNETSAQIMPGIIAVIRGLLDKAHRAGVPVIYVQSVRTLKEPWFTVFQRQPRLKMGTRAAEIVEELRPKEGDIIIQKFCHDPFLRPDLDRVLLRLTPVPTQYYAVVVGGAVNVCVYHTVMGFHLRGFWTVVPVDGVYYLNDAGRQRALEQFSEGDAYPNIFLSRSDLIEFGASPEAAQRRPVPGS